MKISLFLFHLFVQINLTLISTINEGCLIVSLIVYLLILMKERQMNEMYLNHWYCSLIFILFHYLIFTLSYAEILPWETIIVCILFLLIVYYNIRMNILIKRKKDEEIDSRIKHLRMKCQISYLIYSIYTLHLCLTTICTPNMYFNWFLIIRNCQYTYSHLQ